MDTLGLQGQHANHCAKTSPFEQVMVFITIVLTLLMLFVTFVVRDITHRGCCSRHLSFPWGTQGTTRRRHANNDAREIDDFIGCEGDFPI